MIAQATPAVEAFDSTVEGELEVKPSAVATAVERQVQWHSESLKEAAKLIEAQNRLLVAEIEIGKPFDAVDVCWSTLQATMAVGAAAEITDILRVLARHGFRRRHKSEPIRHDLDPTRVSFELEKLTLTVINKGANCRRVKTGEELVDVFEVVCDDPVEVANAE